MNIEAIFLRCRREGECLIWLGADTKGYGQLTGGQYVHVAVFEHFYGPVPAGYEVGHTCDRGMCCEPKHLEAVTRQKNVQDAFLRKRFKRGRYSNEEVRDLRAGKISVRDFAKKYNLRPKTVYNIQLGHKAKWRS